MIFLFHPFRDCPRFAQTHFNFVIAYSPSRERAGLKTAMIGIAGK
jgi:hypothetical protein